MATTVMVTMMVPACLVPPEMRRRRATPSLCRRLQPGGQARDARTGRVGEAHGARQSCVVASGVPQPSTVVQRGLIDPLCREADVVCELPHARSTAQDKCRQQPLRISWDPIAEEAEHGFDYGAAAAATSPSLDDCMGNALSASIPLAGTVGVLPDGPSGSVDLK
jgi:hypothetical protein